MDARRVSKGLGVFSVALGAAELLAGTRIARALGTPGGTALVRLFGAREIAAGVGLLDGPAHSTRVWNRVLGDTLDLAALGLAARRSPRNRTVWGSLALVAGVTALDVAVARALDRGTGRMLPEAQPAT